MRPRKHLFKRALSMGFLVGGGVGFLEALGILIHTRSWYDPLVIPWAMTGYGTVASSFNIFWEVLLGHKSKRIISQGRGETGIGAYILLSLLTLSVVTLGFRINYHFLPELKQKISLVFSGGLILVYVALSGCLVQNKIPLFSKLALKIEKTALLRKLKFFIPLIFLFSIVLTQGIRFIKQDRFFFSQSIKNVKRKPNILFIVLDTASRKHFSCYGYSRSTTPFLEELLTESVLFENAFAVAPWTLPSHASMFTGLYPAKHGAQWKHPFLEDQFTTLAELLQNAKYQTVAFSRNPWVNRNTGMAQGFDTFEEVWRAGIPTNRLTLARLMRKLDKTLRSQMQDQGASLVNRAVKTWLTYGFNHRKPFFLFLNYLEPHLPYSPIKTYRFRFLNEGVYKERHKLVDQINKTHGFRFLEDNKYKDIIEAIDQKKLMMHVTEVELPPQTRYILNALYDAEIAYLDMKLKELLAEFKRLRLLDDTILVIVSDHGENIGEHNLIGHQSCLYDTLIHIPLIMRYPKKIPQGLRFSGNVENIDLLPTLLEMVDPDTNNLPSIIQGKSFLKSLKESKSGNAEVSIAEYDPAPLLLDRHKKEQPDLDLSRYKRDLRALRGKQYKFIWASNGRHELYDIKKDPDEMDNLVDKLPQQLNSLQEELQSWFNSFEHFVPRQDDDAQKVDEMQREQLRSLGYMH